MAAPTQVTEELTAPPTPSQGGKLRPRGANVWARFPAQSWDAIPSLEKRSISRCWSSASPAGTAGGWGELRGLSCLQVLSLRQACLQREEMGATTQAGHGSLQTLPWVPLASQAPLGPQVQDVQPERSPVPTHSLMWSTERGPSIR